MDESRKTDETIKDKESEGGSTPSDTEEAKLLPQSSHHHPPPLILPPADMYSDQWSDTIPERDDEDEVTSDVGIGFTANHVPMSPQEKVRFILESGQQATDDSGSSGNVNLAMHALFCQMDVLCHFEDGDPAWKEAARWLKYEEKVEAGDRWSKPHVATTSLHALMEVRKAIEEQLVILDMKANHGCMPQVSDVLSEAMVKGGYINKRDRQRLVETLLRPHKHQHRKALKPKKENEFNNISTFLEPSTPTRTKTLDWDVENKKKESSMARIKQHIRSVKSDKELSALQASLSPKIVYPTGVCPDKLAPHKANKRLMRKIPGGSEAANIMVGLVDFVQEPVMAFIRLDKAAILNDITEVALPTKFIFLILAPPESASIWQYAEMGRAMAALLTDRVFCEVAYKANTKQDILDGMDEYIDDLTVLPPSIWDPATRLDPPDVAVSMDKIRARVIDSSKHAATPAAFHFAESAVEDVSLTRTGRLFGGLCNDIKRRYPWYVSDFLDGLHIQCLASTMFMYFACITPIITFGGLLQHATGGHMGTMETILSGCLCGIIYHMFAGQPLTIVGATGPMLVFESVLCHFCEDNHINFLPFRFWIGFWTFLMLQLMVAFDLSALVRYITRFTEESFAVLISLIFIFEAFRKLGSIWYTHPIHIHTGGEGDVFKCHCVHPPFINDSVMTTVSDSFVGNESLPAYNLNNTIGAYDTRDHPIFDYLNWTTLVGEDCITYQERLVVSADCITEDECLEHDWMLVGPACNVWTVTHSIPDVFFLSCFLFLGTFTIAYAFRCLRTSKFFPSIVCSTLSDFAVLIAIVVCTGIDIGLGIETPKLQVPTTFKNTRNDRNWMINPLDINNWWLPILAVIPAILAVILIFLDQQISAVIVNRKEHKLKKGHGYHLDLFVLSFLILMCSLMGLPWFVAATVRAITHVRSLVKESQLRAPGEKPQFLGVREQRLTGVSMSILIGVSMLITGVLKYIPMPVLYGVFLYMGVTSLSGVQFVDRILITLMPKKAQPDYVYLRHVETYRVHIFTAIQIVCMATMWAMKSVKKISLLFPIMILGLCFIRKGLDYVFSQSELFWLDHILPEEHRRTKEDDKELGEDGLETSQTPFIKNGDLQESKQTTLLDEENIPQPKSAWHKLVAKRDYGIKSRFRRRKKSDDVIKRYAQRHNVKDAPPTTEQPEVDKTAEPYRDRKFTM